jgi:hypothetical protein
MSTTDWQAHSVRGVLTGALRKKPGLAAERVRRNTECCYKINQ